MSHGSRSVNSGSGIPRWIVLTLLIVGGGAIGGLVRTLTRETPPIRSGEPAATSVAARTSSGPRRGAEKPPALCGAPLESLPPEVITDSTHPQYDPVRLSRLGVDARQIFQAEKRNERFAALVETTVGAQLEKDLAVLVPELKAFKMECRSASCKVEWKVPDHDVENKARSAMKLFNLAPTISYPSASLTPSVLVLMFRPIESYPPDQRPNMAAHFDIKNPRAYVNKAAETRARVLEALRSGRRPLPSRLAGARVPGA
jgi:hypothetical protein